MLDLVKAAQRPHLRVYFAGKVNTPYGLSDWREWFGVKETIAGTMHAIKDVEFVYAGPSIQYQYGADKHTNLPTHGTEHDKHDMHQQTRLRCVDEIDNADVVVAFVDDGCYGTMWELGYCHAKGIETIVYVVNRECWFADPHGADYTSREHHDVSLNLLRDELFCLLKRHQSYHLILSRCQSPLEESVGREWMRRGVWPLLWPQVPEGSYRIDFANPELKLAIELDGFTYHSTREQFGKDRERERYLIEKGWKVIRFHGDEIRNDVGKVVTEICRHLWLRREELAGV